MKYRYLLLPFFVLILFSCATTTSESPEDIGIIAEKTEPVIIIVEDEPAKEESKTENQKSSVTAEEVTPEEEITEQIEFASISTTPREQSAVLNITYPSGTDLSNLSVDGGGFISAIKAVGNTAEITIEGLESLSDYSLSLSYDNVVVIEPINIRTKSFAGRYSWTPADGSEGDFFVLNVEEAPISSDYRYYIYLDPEDSAFPEGYRAGEIRVAPLVDEGEPSLDDTKYKNAPESYKWTNYKWNTGSMTPSKIKYVKAMETETCDAINTHVASVALGFTAESDVWYIFHEIDGKAYLSFSNKMSPDIANKFIKKNPSPNIRPYETDEYWYTLERL